MSWLSSLFSSAASGIVDSVGTAIDKLVTSDEERLQLKNELVKIKLDAMKTAEDQALKAENEITERWKSDNEHIITRLVRPLSYIFVLTLFAIMVLFDGNAFGLSVKQAYIPVIETLLSTMTIAYFGSRGIEKTAKYFNKVDR